MSPGEDPSPGGRLPAAPRGFRYRRLAGGIDVLSVPALAAPHAFTLCVRNAGGHAPFGRRDRRDADLAALGEGLGVSTMHALRQVHGNAVRILPGPGDAPADGAVLRAPGEAVAVQSADCVPILLHAPASGLVAAAHAGWRGTVAGIGERISAALAGESGESPASFLALIGPAIRACCFEVGPEVPAAFRGSGRRIPEAGRNPASGRLHLDLIRANRDQLAASGIRERNIHDAALCTRCGPGFHSYRRDGPGVGRNWSVIVRPASAPAG